MSCAKLLKKFSKLLVHCERADQKSQSPSGLPSGHDAPPPWTVPKPFWSFLTRLFAEFTLKLPHHESGSIVPTPPDNRVKAYSHFAAHCSVTAKAQGKFTRHQNIERYRRLLKTSTDEERRSYLGRLIDEEKQKQKDAGNSEYQY